MKNQNIILESGVLKDIEKRDEKRKEGMKRTGRN